MRSWKIFLPLLASSLCFAAQPDRIPAAIDSSQMVAIHGNVHRMARPQYDLGQVDGSFQFGYVTLVIPPSPAQQAALNILTTQQQDPTSPNFRKWLSPSQYAERFGLSSNDVEKITLWLKSQGLQIVSVGGGRNSVVFAGTAAQIESAFRTQIHRYNVNGKMHVANSMPLFVPAALGGIVTGVRGLSDFRPHPMYVRPAHGGKNGPHPAYTTSVDGSTEYFLAPGDLATIYDLNPLYNGSPAINGTGQKLAIIGQTDVYLDDINAFRSGFGLSQITGCSTNGSGIVTAAGSGCDTTYFKYVLVSGITDTGAPSTCGDLVEADLDIEWSGAIAQDAQIVFVNAPATFNQDCTEITNGGGVNAALAAAINPPNGPPLAPVISMSYGTCEADADLPAESLETELQQAAVEGVTVMNSAGDVASAACDYSAPNANPPYAGAQYGLAVSYPASSPWVTGVGGTAIPITEFSSSYWDTNGTSTTNAGASALASIIGTEVPWNDNPEWAAVCTGNTSSFCENGNSNTGVPITSAQTAQEDLWIAGGGGGVSNCFNSTTNTSGDFICSSGISLPSWQSALDIPGISSPQNTYRAVPDVSLIASANFPGYIFCTPIEYLSSVSPYENETTSSCGSGGAAGIQVAADGIVSGNNFAVDPSIIGGTSASSPVFAGIVTLLNQALGGTGLGPINSKLYAIAGDPSYSAFHHVTTGDNNVYCEVGTPADNPSNVICPSSGVIGFSASNSDANTGYNLVAGLGSVDANELATDWADSLIATTTTISAPSNATGGLPVTLTANVTVSNSAPATGNVDFYVGGSSTSLGTGTLSGGTATLTTSSLPFGPDMVTASYNGLYGASTSPAAAITVTPPDFSMALASPLSPASIPAGQSTTATLVITPLMGADTINFSPSSCSGLPTGASCSFSNAGLVSFGGTPATGTITLTITTTANMTVPSGVQTITITGTEGGTGGTTHTTTASFTITATNQSFTLVPSTGAATFSVNAGSSVQISLNLTGAGSPTQFSPATLPVTYTCSQSTLPSQSSCSWSPSGGSAVSANTVTLTIATTGPTSQLRTPLSPSTRLFYALLLPGMFGIVFASAGRKHGARLLGLIIVLGASTLWLGSCGGSSNSSQNNGGTPAGSYSIVVNATTAGPNPLTATYTVKLTVTN